MRVRLLALAALALIGLAVPAPAFELAEMTMTSCEASDAAADPVAALPLATKPGPQPDATCTVVCSGGSVVSCTGSSCTGVNSACPSQQGYVQCNGVYTYCPSCPPPGCPGGVPSCTSSKQCSITYCGGPGMGICNNGCCYCY